MTTCLFFLLLSVSPLWAQTYAITDFGATGGIPATKAIQAAIDTCHRRGGGEVLVPAGTYPTGTLLLKSNVYLHLLPGSVLQGSYQPADYPEHDILKAKKYGTITHNGLYVNYLKALIIADGLENTGIWGEGTVKGAGEGPAFQLGENKDGKPLNILFIGCTNVLLKGIRVLNSAQVTISISGCDRVVVDGIYVKSLVNWNTDGLDVDGRDVTIANCTIDSEDDALCFKSEYLGRRCENITVTNCTVSSNCNGIKFGTGSRTGFRNITVSNCIIKRPSTDNLRKWNILPGVVRDDKTTSVNTGIVILGVDGGVVENINISNIIMTDVISPFMIRVGRRFQTPDHKPSVMRNITIQHVMAESQSIIPSIIAGLADSPIDNIRFSDIQISIPIGVSIDSLRTFPAVIPEQEKRYPENRMFGLKLPASGFYIRHAKNITFDNVDFKLLAPDSRPVYALDDVKQIHFTGKATAPYAVENEPGKQVYTPTKK
ncbi:MAG: glycoside hydrolase family 28 protein [Bacteroidetes bacterium]|nr:glycoside hydrolase family 28 protein [Fibrella sp.]